MTTSKINHSLISTFFKNQLDSITELIENEMSRDTKDSRQTIEFFKKLSSRDLEAVKYLSKYVAQNVLYTIIATLDPYSGYCDGPDIYVIDNDTGEMVEDLFDLV